MKGFRGRLLPLALGVLALGLPALPVVAPAGAQPARKAASEVRVAWGDPRAEVGETTRVVATVRPRHVARRVTLQVRRHGRWTAVVSKVARGRVAFQVHHRRAGTTRYRVRVVPTRHLRVARSRVHAYRVAPPVPVLPPPDHHQPPPLPDGLLLGVAYGSNQEPAPHERAAGTGLHLRRVFWRADQVERAVSTARADVAAGRTSVASFKLPRTWAEMAAGAGDAWARDLADRMDAVPGEVWIALHHEPERDQPDILDWTRMQQRLAPFFDRDNIRFGVIMTGWPQFVAKDPVFAPARMWPHGAPVDWMGFDVYQTLGMKASSTWTDLGVFWPQIERFAASVGVPWGLTETGITDQGWADPRGRTFFADLTAAVSRHGGSFISYFDTEINADGTWGLKASKWDRWIDLMRVAGRRSVSSDAAGSST
ncbi:hypothetical protein [Nocardioides sp. SYSU D00038]|uniref:hypothetical protein n=1 Tax=Nocardioides sp. SYSU D00038 TaxID=2812554 RepID=UPI001967D6F3|nr:hypothetical protein [Nocardioides sp. SYSU D00038]